MAMSAHSAICILLLSNPDKTHPLIGTDPDGGEGHLPLEARHEAAVESARSLCARDVTQSSGHAAPRHTHRPALAWGTLVRVTGPGIIVPHLGPGA